MAFADRLKELRAENALSASDAAELIGVSASTYYKWEDGTFPRPDAISKICEAYNVTRTWLETGMGEKTLEAQQKKVEEAQAKKKDEHVIKYSRESEERLRDIETVIKFIKQMDVPKERKRHIHKTLSHYRTELENVVLFGELGA